MNSIHDVLYMIFYLEFRKVAYLKDIKDGADDTKKMCILILKRLYMIKLVIYLR